MSSATSTNPARTPKDAPRTPGDSLQPWQFFVLAALGCATAVTYIARGQGPLAIILLGLMMGAAALVGYAALRTVRPLVSPEDDRTVMIGQRTRVALEREKTLALRSIKELEFDRAMGRVSDEDWKEMSGRLRTRAARLIRQLDAGTGYRDQIERDLAKRLEEKGDARLKGSRSTDTPTSARSTDTPTDTPTDTTIDAPTDATTDTRSASLSGERVDARSAKALAERVCASCETQNDHDARFCKACGQALAGR
jgi:hypothetical protein